MLTKQPIWIFGASPVAAMVSTLGFFDKIFDGTEDLDDCIAYLRNMERDVHEEKQETNILARIKQKSPYPLLRHHFGLPSYEQTKKGVEEIAKSGVLDVISLGIDQNTQQFFFRSDQRNPSMDGAGGVSIRNAGRTKSVVQPGF